ncbi:hypothetical protein [Marinivivus vitaminiproducens]|uniref:hypothetical protein n=1 Tax=Marinivivus vitaminiproducens TaxID=3035935 RepID=UPI0027A730A7|nr:hypothetical protein P4R82_24540 [Geminicoccaceae bacterium SCSIO 64248]
MPVVEIPDDLYAQLTGTAEACGLTVAEVIRELWSESLTALDQNSLPTPVALEKAMALIVAAGGTVEMPAGCDLGGDGLGSRISAPEGR